jgi:glutaredoxin 2
VYIIIDEEYEDDTPPNKLIENLVNVVFPKYEVSDVKNLLLNYVNKNKGIKIDDKKYTKMSNIIETNSKILTSMHMARLNRPISYLTFFVKEAYDYVKLQTSDGVFYYELRNKSEMLTKLKERVDVLKKLIEQHKQHKE